MIERPLPTLAAWVGAFANADIPILAQSAAEIALLRDIEEARGNIDAHTLGLSLSNDPLATLKVLVHVARSCARLNIEPPETLVGAILMMGVGPFFSNFSDSLDVDTSLAEHPSAIDGLNQVIVRARRAAHFATGFALKRQDQDVVVIQEAALLQAFAEMLLWCHAPALMLELSQRLKADHTLRSKTAQQEVLGIHIEDLAHELMRLWQLPALLIHCSDQRLIKDPKVLTVTLGARIARHTQHGWDDPHCLDALPDDTHDLAQLLNIAPDAAHRLIRGMDE